MVAEPPQTDPPATDPPPFSRTEQRIMTVMADGKGHTIEELKKCLWEEMGSSVNVRNHIARIRKKLPPDQHIVCVFGRAFGERYYRCFDTYKPRR